MTLVATNVAARGLDINDVQLIIQVLLFIYLIFYDVINHSLYSCLSDVTLYLI